MYSYSTSLVPHSYSCTVVYTVYRNVLCGAQTPKAYCALSFEDVEAAIAHVRRTLPDAPLLAAGNSLGGCVTHSELN